MLESIEGEAGWGSTYKRVLEVADVGIDRGWGLTYKCVLEVADVGIDGGLTYKCGLEVADVEIDRGGGQLINACLKSRMLESIGGGG